MLIGVDSVISWFNQNNRPYWRIFKAGDKYPLFDSANETDEKANIKQSAERLHNCITLLSQGLYYIQVAPKYSFNTYNNTEFKIEVSQSVGGVNGIGNISDINTMIEERIIKERDLWTAEQKAKETEKRLRELEAENKELKKNNPIEKFIGAINPYVSSICDKIGLTKELNTSKITGINDKTMEAEKENTDIDTQVSDLINRWAEADKDFLQVLKKLVEVAENNPEAYCRYKPFLMS